MPATASIESVALRLHHHHRPLFLDSSRPCRNRPRSEPALLNLTERRIRHNFEGVKVALDLTQQQAMGLVRNHPTVLRASMALLRERHAVLRELLQVRGNGAAVKRLAEGETWCGVHVLTMPLARRSAVEPCMCLGVLPWLAGHTSVSCPLSSCVRSQCQRQSVNPPLPVLLATAPSSSEQLDEAPMRTFLLRAPSVLRLADGKLASQMAWLQETAGVSRAQVVRAYRSWPQLATTSKAVLQDRCASGLGGLLQPARALPHQGPQPALDRQG